MINRRQFVGRGLLGGVTPFLPWLWRKKQKAHGGCIDKGRMVLKQSDTCMGVAGELYINGEIVGRCTNATLRIAGEQIGAGDLVKTRSSGQVFRAVKM